MRTMLAASTAALALGAAAQAGDGPAGRERGFAMDAYVGFNEYSFDETVTEFGVQTLNTTTSGPLDLTSESFGAAAMFREDFGDHIIIGAGIVLEGQSVHERTRDETIMLPTGADTDGDNIADGEIVEAELTETVDLGLAYGVRGMAGYAFDGLPVMAYVTAGVGRVDFTKNRLLGATNDSLNKTMSYYEVGAGAEYDFADNIAIFGEVTHREIEDFTTGAIRLNADGSTAFNYTGDYTGSMFQLRVGVRFTFGG